MSDARKPEKKPRDPAHVWTEEETRGFLALMKGEGDEPGFLTRTKMKKLERGKAVDKITALLRKEGVSVTGSM